MNGVLVGTHQAASASEPSIVPDSPRDFLTCRAAKAMCMEELERFAEALGHNVPERFGAKANRLSALCAQVRCQYNSWCLGQLGSPLCCIRGCASLAATRIRWMTHQSVSGTAFMTHRHCGGLFAGLGRLLFASDAVSAAGLWYLAAHGS